MSLRNLSKHFHRSRSKPHTDPSTDQNGDKSPHSSRATSATPELQASEDVAPPDRGDVPEPGTTSIMSMPIPVLAPEPAPEPAIHPHSMDGALAELTPMQGQLDSGPPTQKIDKALDTMGTVVLLVLSMDPERELIAFSGGLRR